MRGLPGCSAAELEGTAPRKGVSDVHALVTLRHFKNKHGQVLSGRIGDQ